MLCMSFFNFRATSGQDLNGELPDMGLVRDGTPCGENLVRNF